MDRLTFRNGNGLGWPDELSVWKLADKLCDYEDAEEQGRLIEFPVALGDYIWVIRHNFGTEVVSGFKVTSLGIDGSTGKMSAGVFAGDTVNGDYFDLSEFGKTIFLTSKEAMEKLKELEGKE